MSPRFKAFIVFILSLFLAIIFGSQITDPEEKTFAHFAIFFSAIFFAIAALCIGIGLVVAWIEDDTRPRRNNPPEEKDKL